MTTQTVSPTAVDRHAAGAVRESTVTLRTTEKPVLDEERIVATNLRDADLIRVGPISMRYAEIP